MKLLAALFSMCEDTVHIVIGIGKYRRRSLAAYGEMAHT